MKKTFALFLVFISLSTFSQTADWCGTKASPSFIAAYAAKNRSNYPALLSERSGISWLPVWYHVVTQDDGTGGAKLKDIFDTHCELNGIYNSFNIGFYIQGIDTIRSTYLWEYNSSLAYNTFSQYNFGNVCNIYVNGNLPGLCGFATFPNSAPSGGGIFLNKSCIGAGTRTLPHEMGHYFGLFHTFETAMGAEYVDGSNCSTAGDLFCDTPADFIDYRSICPYTGNQTDGHGDLYKTVIDPTLLMSYFYDQCVNRFSEMQKAEMLNTLATTRAELANQPIPDITPLDSALFINPLNGDFYVNSTSVVFRWHPVERADYYNFRLQSSTAAIVYADTLIADTVFNAGPLQADRGFRYIVKPFSLANTCAGNATNQFIKTSPIAMRVNIIPGACAGGNNILSIQALTGKRPFTYYLNDMTGDSIFTHVSPGNHSVTIIDNAGDAASEIIQVMDISPVSVNISSSGNGLVALATGGTGPYTYKWSNGATTRFNANISHGDYTITATDSRGCSVIQNAVYSSIGSISEARVGLKVFPNPSSGNTTLNVEVELADKMPGSISLQDINGQTLQQLDKEFTPGSNTVTLHTGLLSPGIYMVRFESGSSVYTEKVSVVR